MIAEDLCFQAKVGKAAKAVLEGKDESRNLYAIAKFVIQLKQPLYFVLAEVPGVARDQM